MFYRVIKVKVVSLPFGQLGHFSEFKFQDSPLICLIEIINGGPWDMFTWPYPEFCATVMDVGQTYKV